VTADGTVTGFGLANPQLAGEREETRQMLEHQPANRPRPGTVTVADRACPGKTSRSSSPARTWA